MHGKIEDAADIKDDDVWEALKNVAQETVIEPLAPEAPPKGYYNPGVLGAELKLLESVVFNSRSAFEGFKEIDQILFSYFYISVTIWRDLKIPIAKQLSI